MISKRLLKEGRCYGIDRFLYFEMYTICKCESYNVRFKCDFLFQHFYTILVFYVKNKNDYVVSVQ